jgi:hypothetical protein
MMLIEKYRHCVAMVDRHHRPLWSRYSRKRKSWIAKRDRAGRQLKRLWARL